MQAQVSNDPTGVAIVNGTSKSKEVDRARLRKANAALDLKLNGASWEDIAEALGYPTGRAALVAVELALEANLSFKDKGKVRELVSQRLESLLRATSGKAQNPDSPEHLAAVGRQREIIADMRKLWGLDAPAEVVVSTPTQRELDAVVGSLLERTLPQVEEADIVDGEVISDIEESA